MANDWQKFGQIFGQTALTVICALLAIPAAAQSVPDVLADEGEVVEDVRYYSVEVIVFEYASNVSGGTEVFDPVETEEPEELAGMGLDSDLNSETGTPVYGDMAANSAMATHEDDAIEFGDIQDLIEEEITDLTPIPSLFDIEFRLLAEEELTMSEIHARLLTLDAYLPVLWGGWIQSTHEQEVTPPILLRTLGLPPLHIDGTLTLYLRNYLHLAVDLTREQQIATIQPVYQVEKPSRGDRSSFENELEYNVSDNQTIIYQIQEDRLFNSGQLRYYDHPKFGVLARVNRVEIADPDDDEESEESPDGRSMLSATQ